MTAPAVSVIVPTRKRIRSLLRLLAALERQDVDAAAFEVIVVFDGDDGGTEARVRRSAWRFPLHVLDVPPGGPARARNCGAALARGQILLFLDDDVEPTEGCIRAHRDCHRDGARRVGLGYLPPVPAAGGFFGAMLRGWWESMFDGPRRPTHRYTFRDLLTGHFSIERDDFDSLRGFAADLSCHEDWEFGYRAIASGLQFAFLPAAIAWHHDDTDIAKALARKFEEGIADVQLARLHPELARVLPLGWPRSGPDETRVARLAWRHPRAAGHFFRATLRLLPVYERWCLRFRWRARLERALTFWYWRGVAHTLGSPDALAALLEGAPRVSAPSSAVDLSSGVDEACRRLDDLRPRSAIVLYRGREIGTIPDGPGSEPLRGVHLRAALAGPLARQLAHALAAEHELPEPLASLLRSPAANSETRASKAFAA